MGLASAPTNLDPRFATDAASSRINRLLYRQLVDFDDSGMAIPSLARWQVISPKHYRFTLGKGGRAFHHGRRLTAGDVKATYDFVLDPTNGSPHRGALTLIERIEVVDEERVDFHLHRPDPLFPAYLVIGILPAEQIASGHPFASKPLGSGPFTFQAWPEEGRLRLKRLRDDQVLEFLAVKEPTVRILKLLRGEVDLIQNDLPPELIAYLKDKEGIRMQRRPGSNFSYLGFNLQDPATAIPEVRRAIAYAIDREAIIQHLMKGMARPASALFPPEHWAGASDLSGYDHDPARARALLAQAGYSKEQPLRLVYKTSSDPFRVRMATVIQSQLAEAGIEVDLRSYDWGTFFGDIKEGRFQMYSLAWVGIKTPDIFRYIFHSESIPPQGANRGRFADPVVDDLIERAEQLSDTGQRADLYRELQQHLLERLPYVPLWYEEHIAVSGERIRGYELAGDGNYDSLERVELVHTH
jgi:peptide/nickel transport system substrate-binding protein